MEINKDTQLCMSLSARPSNFGTRFHNYLYKAHGLNFIYKAFRVEEDVEGAIRGIRALSIRGCAVSMPHKERCIPFLDELSSSAAAIQSVNTIVNDNGYLRAYNTDYLAIQMLLNENAASTPSSSSTRFLLKGSGGMAKAAVAALRDAGYANGCVVARNEGAGRALAEQYGFDFFASEEEAFEAAGQEGLGLMVINCTPVGMSGSSDADALAFKASTIETAIVVFDVVAMPIETPMIAYARRCVSEGKHKIVVDGGEVVVRQALEQFVLYTGVRPEQEHVDAAAAHARIGL